MAEAPKKPKPSRLTLAPLYLAAGLAVCYLVLTHMIPALGGIAEGGFERQPEPSGWFGLTLRLSALVRENSQTTIACLAIVGVAGFVLPILVRPAKYLVWAMALIVFLLAVGFVAGSYGHLITRLLRDATAR